MNNSYSRIRRTYDRLKWIFVGIFAVANVGILVWTCWLEPLPEQRCVGGPSVVGWLQARRVHNRS